MGIFSTDSTFFYCPLAFCFHCTNKYRPSTFLIFTLWESTLLLSKLHIILCSLLYVCILYWICVKSPIVMVFSSAALYKLFAQPTLSIISLLDSKFRICLHLFPPEHYSNLTICISFPDFYCYLPRINFILFYLHSSLCVIFAFDLWDHWVYIFEIVSGHVWLIPRPRVFATVVREPVFEWDVALSNEGRGCLSEVFVRESNRMGVKGAYFVRYVG